MAISEGLGSRIGIVGGQHAYSDLGEVEIGLPKVQTENESMSKTKRASGGSGRMVPRPTAFFAHRDVVDER